MRALLTSAIGLLMLMAGSTAAHHSMAKYDVDQRAIHEGVLKAIDWRQPHVSVLVEFEDDAGELVTWSYEGPAPEFFRTRSFNRSDFEDSLGKTITIEASLNRDGTRSALIREIRLNNGKLVSACPQYC